MNIHIDTNTKKNESSMIQTKQNIIKPSVKSIKVYNSSNVNTDLKTDMKYRKSQNQNVMLV